MGGRQLFPLILNLLKDERNRNLYRHSRVSGNPAGASQDYGIIREYRRDSRLRGNDGGVDAGMTVTETPSPYHYRVRRMVFLQVADQVRLCRARARYWFGLVECCSLS